MTMIATLIDGKALLDVTLVSFCVTVAAVTAYGTAVLAADRIGAVREPGPGHAAPWLVAIAVAGLACAGILAFGIWAMTHK
jgi:hypothetical protein